MARIYNLNPISHITVASIGPPGQRVFYLQGSRGDEIVSLVIEKQHALALVSSLDELLAELEARFPRPSHSPDTTADTTLREPVQSQFRVGQIGLGYDEQSDLIVLIAYELSLEEEKDVSVARFWGNREQMRTLRDRALSAVEGGRPTCTICGEMIESGGHLCPRQNGHGNNPKFEDFH